MSRFICIHGHFYQPPRENPWLEEVESQDSAYPHHDWNQRILAECYAPNTASRILDHDRRIIAIVNNYSKISFNFSPTLFHWMEKHHPYTCEAIIEADRLSRERFSGHGAAIAQVYNHMIMPLANRRDKCTQVAWGIRDFEKRFGRSPEGMWLPETAVDLETLDILSEAGIAFTILAPHQAARVRPLGTEEWQDVSGARIDPTRPYLCRLPSGRTINLFFYDGPISQDLAFGELLKSGEAFAERLVSAFSEGREWPQLVHIATDGETYGHHQSMGDMALAYCLHHIETQNLAEITIYGEFLERFPPDHEVEIIENSSWSCVHGVERWRDDCGCNSGKHPQWSQAWRRPLREAMDWLRDRLIPLFELEAGALLGDHWRCRDEYIEVVLDRSRENVEAFLARHTARGLTDPENNRVLRLLELQRHTMLMFTSCAWFFDEISGIEPTQVMRYAARAIQIAEESFDTDLEQDFMQILEKAPTNMADFGNGAAVYDMFVKAASLDLLRVTAHYATSSLFEESLEDIHSYCYRVEPENYERIEGGTWKLNIGRIRIVSETTWDQNRVSFAALHLGDQNVITGLRETIGEQAFADMHWEIKNAFNLGDITELVRSMDKHFGSHYYTLWHLFKDEQQKVLSQILTAAMEDVQVAFRQIVDRNYTMMNYLRQIQRPLPKALSLAAEYILNRDLAAIFESEDPDVSALERLIDEVKRWSITVDSGLLQYQAGRRIEDLLARLVAEPEDPSLLEWTIRILQLLGRLSIDLNLWRAQNSYFALSNQALPEWQSLAAERDADAGRWVALFLELGRYLNVKVS